MLSIDKVPTESAIQTKRKALRVQLHGLHFGFFASILAFVAVMQWLCHKFGEANLLVHLCIISLICIAPLALILTLKESDEISQRISGLSWLTVDSSADESDGWNCRKANRFFETSPLAEVQQYRRKVINMGRPFTIMEMNFLLEHEFHIQSSKEKQHESLEMQQECQKLYAS